MQIIVNSLLNFLRQFCRNFSNAENEVLEVTIIKLSSNGKGQICFFIVNRKEMAVLKLHSDDILSPSANCRLAFI